MLAIQYLEESPELAGLDAEEVGARLHDALQRLPLDIVILGWSVLPRLVDACACKAARAGARLYRWQPMLAGCVPQIDPRWRVVGLDGEPVPGYLDKPEFTFICPNNEAAVQAVLDEFKCQLSSGPYQGVFLDRIRFPSPASNPARSLGCFCDSCRQAAAGEGLDLDAVRGVIQAMARTFKGRKQFLSQLFSAHSLTPGIEKLDQLGRYLAFRERSISCFVEKASAIAWRAGLKVGLDCFSPALARMVGQNLGVLSASCDWIKIMTYGHCLAPAGLPYELMGLANWLEPAAPDSEREALHAVSQAGRLALPPAYDDLRRQGIRPPELAAEVVRARQAGITTLLAGIELVDLAGVTALDPAQIRADLRAFRRAGPDGLVLSWDLWRVPLERLDLVREAWLGGNE